MRYDPLITSERISQFEEAEATGDCVLSNLYLQSIIHPLIPKRKCDAN